MSSYASVLTPNRVVSTRTARLIVMGQLGVLLLVWTAQPMVMLSTPSEIVGALWRLWQLGLGGELLTSFYLNLEAIALSTVISLLLAYSTVLPFFRPVVVVLSKLRFLSLAGLTFLFTMLTRSGHQLKLSLLVFSVSVFFVTGMADVVAQIPKEKFDLARTLRMGEWRVVWEVVVLGRIDQVFEVLRQNAAIGWMMITMIEGMSRAEGGVGTLLLNSGKLFRLDEVFAIQLTILLLGLGQDYLIGLFKRLACPYAELILEKR